MLLGCRDAAGCKLSWFAAGTRNAGRSGSYLIKCWYRHSLFLAQKLSCCLLAWVGVLPGMGGVLPGMGGVLSGMGEVLPGMGEVLPDMGGVPPGMGGLLPGMSGVLPGMGGALPGMGGVLPDMGGVLPGTAGVLPGMGGVLPGMGGVLPGMGGILPGMGGHCTLLQTMRNGNCHRCRSNRSRYKMQMCASSCHLCGGQLHADV